VEREVLSSSSWCPVLGGNGSTGGPDRRKHFFIERVAKRWHRLPGEVADAPSLPVLEGCLDNALNTMI